MTEFIKHIENKIGFFLTPKHIIFDGYENNFIKSLIKDDFKSLNLHFDNEIASDLLSFFQNFGQGLKDEEIKLCRYTTGRIDNAIEKAEKEIKNKIKVYRALVLFAGATLSILII